MNDIYVRLPTPARAWKYDRQPQAEWPAWVREIEVATPLGLQRIGAGAGVLLVPTKSGTTLNVLAGDYVVMEGAVLSIVKGGDFFRLFTPDETPSTDTP